MKHLNSNLLTVVSLSLMLGLSTACDKSKKSNSSTPPTSQEQETKSISEKPVDMSKISVDFQFEDLKVAGLYSNGIKGSMFSTGVISPGVADFEFTKIRSDVFPSLEKMGIMLKEVDEDGNMTDKENGEKVDLHVQCIDDKYPCEQILLGIELYFKGHLLQQSASIYNKKNGSDIFDHVSTSILSGLSEFEGALTWEHVVNYVKSEIENENADNNKTTAKRFVESMYSHQNVVVPPAVVSHPSSTAWRQMKLIRFTPPIAAPPTKK